MISSKLTAIVAVLAIATPALAQKSNYRNPVADTGTGSFAIINKWNHRDDDIWCNAARAARERGAAWSDRLYVTDVSRQSGTEAISFTFRPTQEQLAQARSGRSNVRGVGNNMTINSANRRCTRELDLF